jgi:DNA-binding HxlR family transcriptional regulator
MSPARTSARERARRRELRKEMDRIAAIAAQRLRELVEEGLLQGRVEPDGTVVIEED